eukprot:6184350-Pleurochrysis_carterae.AAC.1
MVKLRMRMTQLQRSRTEEQSRYNGVDTRPIKYAHAWVRAQQVVHMHARVFLRAHASRTVSNRKKAEGMVLEGVSDEADAHALTPFFPIRHYRFMRILLWPLACTCSRSR